MSNSDNDVYSGNYPKAKRLALARSGGQCQFCGLWKAREGHHWAWPDYPSAQEVQGHDLTALCKPCHELATVMRDWVGRQDATLADLNRDLNKCSTFVAKREVFSYWLYPDGDEKYTGSTFQSSVSTPKKRSARYNASKEKESPWFYLFWFVLAPAFVVLLIYAFNS